MASNVQTAEFWCALPSGSLPSSLALAHWPWSSPPLVRLERTKVHVREDQKQCASVAMGGRTVCCRSRRLVHAQRPRAQFGQLRTVLCGRDSWMGLPWDLP